MKSCEEGNYPSQKPHRRIKKHRLEETTEAFVCAIVSDTAFHNGFLLQSTVSLSGPLCSWQKASWLSETHDGQLMCELIQVVVTPWDLSHGQHRISIFPLAPCVHDTQSFLLLTFARGDSVVWLGGVMWPRGAAVSSVRCRCSADLAVQPLELRRPRLRWLSCWRPTAQWQGLEPLL